MALTREPMTKDDGTAGWHYTYVDDTNGQHAVVMTPTWLRGPHTVSDGTVYDLEPDYVEVRHDHLDEVHAHIKARHVEHLAAKAK